VTRLVTIALAILAYLILPGHPGLPLHGIPWGLTGTVIAALAAVAAVTSRGIPLSRRATLGGLILVAACGGVRLSAALTAVPHGWLGQYFANDTWSGSPQWSSDFRWKSATRLDPTLSFEGDTFPLHYLNGHSFARDTRREVTEPLSVIWRGQISLVDPATVALSASFRGHLRVTMDGLAVLEGDAHLPQALTQRRNVSAGTHDIMVRYAKAAGLAGLLTFEARTGDGSNELPIRPPGAVQTEARWVRGLASIANGVVLTVLGGVLLLAARTHLRDRKSRLATIVAITVASLFGVQGWMAARPLENRYVALGAGDDWFGFESRARNVLEGGLLMPLDAPLGQGAPYFYHPFYSYFLAALHALTGESLAGPIFIQFLILACVTLMMWTVVRRHFGDRAGIFGTVSLVALLQLDFVRYYTVTLLSENLYVLTVTVTLVTFLKWAEHGKRSDLIAAGAWAGVSSITRPAMMMFLGPAVLVAALTMWRRSRRLHLALMSPALLAAVWLAVVAPVTLRNWIVSGRPVLISEGVGTGFVRYNVPDQVDPAPYLLRHNGSAGSGLLTLAQIAWEHPWGMLKLQASKIGFSLGMVHWRNAYQAHPELVAATLLYLTMCCLSARLRSSVFWPFHAFVTSHVASMGLTDPANYGYRLILPPFVYTTSLGVAALIYHWHRSRSSSVSGSTT
jgi:hypothetical protein